MNKHLFVSPHPDDVELGCGALIAKLVAQGEQVYIVVVTGGGTLNMVHSGEAVDYHTRLSEQYRSLEVLGVPVDNMVVCQGYQASKFDEESMSGLVSQLDTHIRDLKPTHLYVPLPSYNQDHKYTFEACMAATRPTKADKVSIYAYEQPIQHHDALTLSHIGGKLYIEVTEAQVLIGIRALNCHQSQMAGREHTLTGGKGVRLLGHLRGAEIGSPYAIRLTVIKEVRS